MIKCKPIQVGPRLKLLMTVAKRVVKQTEVLITGTLCTFRVLLQELAQQILLGTVLCEMDAVSCLALRRIRK